MNRINKEELKDWIRPYLTINGKYPDVDEKLREINILKYFSEITLPPNFEKYAIILHSYWIFSLSENQIERMEFEETKFLTMEQEFPEDEYIAVSWNDFYNLKNVNFELHNAVKDSVDWRLPFQQMNNELYPGEGIIDKEHLKLISETCLKHYGNQDIELYYIFLATNNWEEDKMFEAKISELMDIIENENTERTPSLIYSIDKKWAINTDIDLKFSIIGGEENFLTELIQMSPKGIYQI